MTVPIEFVVAGRPSSVNSTSSKKATWKSLVRGAADAELLRVAGPVPIPAPHRGDVTVKVFFFPPSAQYLDVDNGLKHTIDAFSPPVLANDRSVQRLIAERFLPVPGASMVVPVSFAPVLARALVAARGTAAPGARGPAVQEYTTAVKVEPYLSNGGALW